MDNEAHIGQREAGLWLKIKNKKKLKSKRQESGTEK